MGSQPGTQRRPEALVGVDMNLIKAVPVFVASVLDPAMAHGTVIKPPCHQALVDVVLISVNAGSGSDEPLDQDGSWPVGRSPASAPPPLRPAGSSRKSVASFLQGSPTPRALQAAPTTPAAFFSLRLAALYARPPHRPRRIPLPRTGSGRVGGRRSLGTVARPSVACRPRSIPDLGRSGHSISLAP